MAKAKKLVKAVKQVKRSGNADSQLLKLLTSGAGALGKVGGAALRGVIGLPFETSGGTAVATPAAIGPVQVSAPQANGYLRTTKAAKFSNGRNGSCSITHREYITDIVPVTETNANVFQLLVNQNITPSNPEMFAWLSTIASRFESYRFRSLRFLYEPQCSTTTPGTVNMVVDYDALDDPPTSKLQMMAYKGAVRSPPWFCSNFTSDPSDFKSAQYYIRNSAQIGGGDARLYDLGRLYVAYEGPAASSVAAGELYVEYTVDLMTPNLEPYVLSGIVDLNNSPGAVTPAAYKVASKGPMSINVVGNNVATGNFLFGPSVPGTYWVSVFSSATAGSQASALEIFIPTGSNAVLQPTDVFGDYTAGTSFTSATAGSPGFTTTSVAVFFPTTSDLALLQFGNAANWGTLGSNHVLLQLAPLAQETAGVPVPAVSNPLPSAMLAAVERIQKLSLLDREEQKAESRYDRSGSGSRALIPGKVGALKH